MDLTTKYLGMKLKNPLVPSASPLSEDLPNIRRMEDHGASAVVLYSLFEEQLLAEGLELNHHLEADTHAFAEAMTFFPEPQEFRVGPDEYLEHIRKAKEAVGIPIIASLNGTSEGGWIEYARQIEQAGADAMELNIYSVATDPVISGTQVEQDYVDVVKAVKKVVRIPVAVKLSPFFSNLSNLAQQLDAVGTEGLVLFNRFYQPDIDLDELEVRPSVVPSTPFALRLPLRWIAILYGHVQADLAGTSGIHTPRDVLKMLMAGARVTQLCSALLKHGISHIADILLGVTRWMEENEYESIAQMQGSLSQRHCPDPAAFERAQYIKTLKSFSYMRR